MKQQRPIDKSVYDAIVIGSGVSGLACAVDLARAGLSVLVLEQHYQPGGMTSIFKRKGFLFEAGGHRVTGVHDENSPLYDTLRTIGGQVQFTPIRPSYVAYMGDRRIEGDLELPKYRQNLLELFPDRQKEIDAFLADMLELKAAADYLDSLQGPPDFEHLSSQYPLFVRYMEKTTTEFLADRFPHLDSDLVFFLTLVGSYTTLPIDEQSFLTFSRIWATHHSGEGMNLITGGTKTLIDLLVGYVDSHGGRVVMKKMVEEVLVKDGRAVGVRTRDGDEITADAVISAASDEQTYLKMLKPELLPVDFLSQIRAKKPSGAVFQVYLGLEDGPGLENVSTFIYQSPEFIHEGVKKWDMDVITSTGLISVQGHETAPKGYRAINISSPCPYEHPDNWFIRGGDTTEYRAFKKWMAERIIQNMTRYIPDLENRIQVMETATPLTMERYTLATAGAIHGLANSPDQSGQRRGPIQTPIQGLYHVGQYVVPSGGIHSCILSGKLGARLVLEGRG